jgi:hypothetical protein
MLKSFDQLVDETRMRFGGLQVKGIEEVYGEQSIENKVVFAKDTYINMCLLHSVMDLGFDVMEQALRDEIWEMERVAE